MGSHTAQTMLHGPDALKLAEIKHWRGFRSIYISEITVAPPIPGLFIVEDAVWKIKADGRIVNRLTGALHPDQIRTGKQRDQQ